MATYNKRKEKGLCPNCGEVPPEGRILCLSCATKNQEVFKQRKDKHLCERCSAKVTGTRLCNTCSVEQRETKNTIYQFRKQNSLCVYCGKPNSEAKSRNSCDECRKTLTSKRRLCNLHLSREEKNRARIMLAQFDGKCQICGSESAHHKNGWALDHCHATQKFRGILCQPCNCLLGFAKENLQTLLNSVTYLTRFKENVNESNRVYGELPGNVSN